MGRLIRGGGCVVFVAAFAGIYLANHGLSRMSLSDGLTLGGLMLLLWGGLRWLAEAGALDGLLYCGHALLSWLLPGRRAGSYGDFLTRRQQRPHAPMGLLLTIGTLATLLGILLVEW